MITDNVTLEADLPLSMLRRTVLNALERGDRITCPCCDKSVAYDRKTLNSGLCKSLKFLYDHVGWACPSRELSHTLASAASLLRHWGLAESKVPVSKSRGKDSGLWKITHLGRQFVDGVITLPRSIRTYNGKLLGPPEGKDISFTDANVKKYTDPTPFAPHELN